MAVLAPLILLFVMYLFLVRPQQQRARRQRELITTLSVGDEVLTVGGLVGTIVSLSPETAELEIADGVVVTFVRAAVSRKMADATPPAGSDDGDGDGDSDVIDDTGTPAGDTPELGA